MFDRVVFPERLPRVGGATRGARVRHSCHLGDHVSRCCSLQENSFLFNLRLLPLEALSSVEGRSQNDVRLRGLYHPEWTEQVSQGDILYKVKREREKRREKERERGKGLPHSDDDCRILTVVVPSSTSRSSCRDMLLARARARLGWSNLQALIHHIIL